MTVAIEWIAAKILTRGTIGLNLVRKKETV